MNQQRTKTIPKPLKIVGFSLLVVLLIITICVTLVFAIPDNMNYVVNSDQKTCTVTGAKNPHTLVLHIPEKIDGYTVTAINDKAFSGYPMRIVILPKTITKLGESAFSECRKLLWIRGIQKCSDLLEISKFAFLNCRSLLSIELPESVKTINDCAFAGCLGLKNISIPSNVYTIGLGAFTTCLNFNQIYIPASVNSIKVEAFNGCLFLKEISVDESNPYWCSIDGVLYFKDMTTLHSYPAGKRDKLFVIPDGVTTIGSYSFAYSMNLEVLNIPNSVIKIGSCVFYDLVSKSPLTTINYDGTIEMWNSIQKSSDWDSDSPNFTIYCTDGQIAKDGTVTYN